MLFEISSPKKTLVVLKVISFPLKWTRSYAMVTNKRGYIQAHATNQIALVIYFY